MAHQAGVATTQSAKRRVGNTRISHLKPERDDRGMIVRIAHQGRAATTSTASAERTRPGERDYDGPSWLSAVEGDGRGSFSSTKMEWVSVSPMFSPVWDWAPTHLAWAAGSSTTTSWPLACTRRRKALNVIITLS